MPSRSRDRLSSESVVPDGWRAVPMAKVSGAGAAGTGREMVRSSARVEIADARRGAKRARRAKARDREALRGIMGKVEAEGRWWGVARVRSWLCVRTVRKIDRGSAEWRRLLGGLNRMDRMERCGSSGRHVADDFEARERG